jgi:AraC-like DNA-binding protein
VARLDLHASFFGGPGFTLYHAWGRNSSLSLNPHFHDEYLISAQLRGRESCHVSGKLQTFDPGDVVLINPHQVHTGNTEGEQDLEYITLYVDREIIESIADQAGGGTRTPEFTVIKAAGYPAVVDKLGALLELVRERDSGLYPTAKAAEEPDIQHPASLISTVADAGEISMTGVPTPPDMLSIESAVHDVVISAFEEFSNMRQPMLRSTRRLGHRKVAKAVEYIESLPTGDGSAPPSLDDLAQVAGLSKYHFLRQFSQIVGMTPGSYMRTLRLCHAARKLRTSDMPILDIALSVGFADHPSFSRAFARHMGMTPSDYQRLGPL